MMNASTFFLFFLLVCGSHMVVTGRDTAGLQEQAENTNYNNMKVHPRMFNGTETERDEFPDYAKVEIVDEFVGTHYCGASLVAHDVILTAAHCDPSVINHTIAVMVGVYNRSTTAPEEDRGERFEIAKVVRHPKYNTVTYQDDIMLIKLDGATPTEPVRVNKEKIVPLWFQNVTAVGWGALYFANDTGRWMFPSVQHRVELPHGEAFACNQPDKLCTGGQGKGLCSGDSGGPLLVLGDTPNSTTVQVGIANSFRGGEHCTGYSQHLFHRTSYTFPWMRRTICLLSNDPPEYLQCEVKSSTQPSASPSESPSCTSSVKVHVPVNATTLQNASSSNIEPSEVNDEETQWTSSSTASVHRSFTVLQVVGGVMWFLSFLSIP